MRIIFMGNPAFAVPSLKKIASSDHNLVAVVSNFLKKMGRGKQLKQTPISEIGAKLGIPLIQPTNLLDPDFIERLSELKPDLLVVVAFRILPLDVLSIPKQGAVNLHGSLLPAYRGAAPIQWALINGEIVTGVTTFLIQPKVDTGDILLQRSIPIREDDNYGTMSEKLALLGADLVVETLDKLATDDITPIPQDHNLATPAPKIKPQDCIIDWSQSAEAIHNRIRGLTPVPGVYTMFKGKRLKISKTQVMHVHEDKPPGTVIKVTGKLLWIHTGEGAISILSAQKEGKRRMAIDEFLRGASIKEGDSLGY